MKLVNALYKIPKFISNLLLYSPIILTTAFHYALAKIYPTSISINTFKLIYTLLIMISAIGVGFVAILFLAWSFGMPVKLKIVRFVWKLTFGLLNISIMYGVTFGLGELIRFLMKSYHNYNDPYEITIEKPTLVTFFTITDDPEDPEKFGGFIGLILVIILFLFTLIVHLLVLFNVPFRIYYLNRQDEVRRDLVSKLTELLKTYNQGT